MTEGPRRRLLLLSILLTCCVLVIVAQLVKVQVLDHQFYKEWAEEQRVQSVMMEEPPRGVIRDRDGHLLAGNTVMYAIEAAPAYVVDKEKTSKALGAVLHMPASYIKQKMEAGDVWVPIASPVSRETKEKVVEQPLTGITVRPFWVREYPEGALASHALGFYNAEKKGYYGVEGFYDVMLQPQCVEREGPVDVASEPVPWAVAPVVLPRPGIDLELTLDRTVQALVEEELIRAVRAYQAEGGTIIVMNPHTFGILALASWPEYDPGRYVDFTYEDPAPFEDPAVSKQYEPGSVFKILTVAAALDEGLVVPETTYYDQGWIEVGGQVIKNASHHTYGEQTVADIMIESLNTGVAWLGTLMGPDVFYQYVRAFGIGQPTGVDLAGEVSGQLWLPDDYEHWHASNLGVNTFGQGVAVTPIQMIAAVSTVANGGTRLQPHIVGQRIAPDGAVSTFSPVAEAQVVSPQTARTLTEILVRVVEEGVPQAQVDGYRVAGKTGTAQIPIPGGYAQEETITSFVGFGPVMKESRGAEEQGHRGGEWPQQIVILVKLDRPKTSRWASKTAAPTFQRLATRLFTVLGIPPSSAGHYETSYPQRSALAEARR